MAVRYEGPKVQNFRAKVVKDGSGQIVGSPEEMEQFLKDMSQGKTKLPDSYNPYYEKKEAE